MSLSNSVYQLPHSLEQIETTQSVIKLSTRKIQPTSSSTGTSFPSSVQVYDFSLSSNQYWLPNRSFLVIEDQILVPFTPDGGATVAAQPTEAYNIAPAFNCAANLFEACELTIGGFSLGSKTKMAPQIHSCMTRLTKSASTQEGVGYSALDQNPSFAERKAQITSDGELPGNYGLVRAQQGVLIAPPPPSDSQGAITDNYIPLTGTLAFTAATGLCFGTDSAFTQELQVGDWIKISSNTLGAAVRLPWDVPVDGTVQVTAILNDTNMFVSAFHTDVPGGVAGNIAYGYKVIQNPPSARANRNQRLYQPPLGVFNQGKSLPPARYQIRLTPQPEGTYQQCAIQGYRQQPGGPPAPQEQLRPWNGQAPAVGAPWAQADADFSYSVTNIFFVACIVDRDVRAPSKSNYVLDLNEIDVIPRQYLGNAGQNNFTVAKSTVGLGFAVQSTQAARNSLFTPSLFVCENDDAGNNGEQSISRIRVDYDGQSKPQPEGILAMIPPNDISTWYMYGNTAVNSLGWYDTGGFNTKEVMKELGPLFYFAWNRPGSSISTNVDVAVTYGGFAQAINELLFYSYRHIVTMSIEDGQVLSFLSQAA